MDKSTLLEYLYICYMEARKHKRHTHSQMTFEQNLGENLVQLRDDVYNGKYKISPSIYFIQMNPIQREVFAGNFRDRIIHHLIYDIISPYREKQFIYDCYSCRKGKGTSKGIERIEKFMRSCSNNYKEKGRILKMDIQGYFMSINKNILREKNVEAIDNRPNISKFGNKNNDLINRYPIHGEFPKFLKKVIYDVIFNDPTQTGIFKGKMSDYNGLPETKSLFFTKENCGLPIGNLTSQLFSNIYMNDFDHYIKDTLKIKYYGRYVDDFVIIHKDKEYLKSIIPQIKNFLKDELHLTLHPKKIYLQEIKHGVQFLGAYIKPYRKYRAKRTIGNFYNKMKECNREPGESSLNSYLGLFIHYNQYNLVKKFMSKIKLTNIKRLSEIVKYYQQ